MGDIETTTEPMRFVYPDNENVVLVDLPGIGTPNFPEKTYPERVALKNYDIFLILTGCRFTENDLKLAKIVKEMGKPFFLIRTKIEEAVRPKGKRARAPINEEETQKKIKKIRNNCFKNVKNLISSEKDIFLIDSYENGKWDFENLIKAIVKALTDRQKECLILSLSNVTRKNIERKANYFRGEHYLVKFCNVVSAFK